MRAASSFGGQTAWSWPLMFRQHLRDLRIVSTAWLSWPPALASAGDTDRVAFERAEDDEAGMAMICRLEELLSLERVRLQNAASRPRLFV